MAGRASTASGTFCPTHRRIAKGSLSFAALVASVQSLLWGTWELVRAVLSQMSLGSCRDHCGSAVRIEVLSVPGCCGSSTACEIWHEAFENSHSKLESQWVIKGLLQLKSIRVGDGGGREDAGVRGNEGSRLQSKSEWQTAGTPQGSSSMLHGC